MWMCYLVAYYICVAKFCVIYNVNVWSCSFLNVCNKNDQLKVSGHNCSSLSFPYIFHRKPNVYENLHEVSFAIRSTHLTDPDKRSYPGELEMNTFYEKALIRVWCNNIKAPKLLLRFYKCRLNWLTVSSSGHEL